MATAAIPWVEPGMVRRRDRWWPDFADDPGFTGAWWGEAGSFSPPEYQWRSYVAHDEEVARVLLGLRFLSHAHGSSASALLLWNLEVREDLRGTRAHVGTTVVNQLVEEFGDREIYVGPTSQSTGFWARFRWAMCDCDDCRGNNFIVRRPGSTARIR